MGPDPDNPDTLVCGPLSVELDGTDVRRVRWHGVEVVNRLYGAVRDTGWATIQGAVEGVVVSQGNDDVLVAFTSDHSEAGMPFRWEGSFQLSPDSLVAVFDGLALEDQESNRIGWCLLHPLTQVGGTLHHAIDDEAGEDLTLPSLVAPQPVTAEGDARPAWGPFNRLAIEAEGVRVEARFEGDLFETEDQRNWTDASFKTYSTPLSEPMPHRLRAGDRVRQVITLRFSEADTPASAAPLPEPVHRATVWSARLTSPMPLGGLDEIVEAIRVVVGPDLDAATDLVALARDFGRWELEVHATPETDWQGLAALLADGSQPECVIVLEAGAVSGQSSERTSPELHALAADALSSVANCPVGGGTPFNFTELQRYPLDHLPLISWTFSPTVHAVDEASIRETPASYPAIVATARAIAPSAELAVGPLRDDPAGMPDGWLTDSLATWHRLGVDRLCTVDAACLVEAGRLTTLGVALARARVAG